MLQLLASGLQFWIRQQCQAVESLELQLHGSSLGLLRGRLDGVSLVARGVVFSSLEIERVELRSDAIEVQVGNLLRGKAVQLEHPFNIEGSVAFSAGGLGRSLCTPHWRPLGDQLVDGLLGLTPLKSVSIERDRLVLQAQEHRCETIPRAVDGHLELCGEDGKPCVALPADPNITIEEANLEGGLLQLQGRARVSP
ncbi:MAG: DUF2993 domain-containing protein [Cyanobacteria bacterium M_surface_7_m2_037]|nr:DUF2993 domain-containing protein [Cyanobacteria bacterium K_DeepCast_0m_m1_088]MBM5795491.1 DUF2993 domain-containing protein [Cyanobacteria bacterium M_surface_7_m2_037]MBM5819136.1 DUF2993 domain-containing protein [Cyanobacteria bacterium K_DeepCast_150m_m2_101]